MTTSTLALVERAHDSLLVGYAAESATARHHAAQIAALRAAAAVVAARDRRDRSSSLGPVSLWDLLGRLTPELSEWARHFAVLNVHDLLRDAEAFLARAELVIGLPTRVDPTPRLAPVRSA